MSERYEQRPFALPADATEVLLVRHGASAAFEVGRPFDLLDGQADPPLAPAGEQQAERVADRLAGTGLTRLFVTTLQRTSQTAAPLAAKTGLVPEVVADLREVHLGDWEGGEFRARASHGDPLVAELFAQQRWDVIPGAEAMADLAARVRAGMATVVAATGPGASAAAFVHGGVIGELCHQATASRRFAFMHADNGSITRLVVLAGGHWLLRGFNDVAHLAGGVAPPR